MISTPPATARRHLRRPKRGRRERLIVGPVIVSLVLVASACGSSGDSSGPAPSSTTTTATGVTTTSPPPSTTTTTPAASDVGAPAEPVEVVEAFYAAWDMGNIEEAMSRAGADFTSSLGDAPMTAEFMDYVFAVGRSLTLSDCNAVANGLSHVVTCTVEQTDPLIEALALHPPRVKHTLTDGALTKISFDTTYAKADAVLGSFARETDPEGYSAACDLGGSGTDQVAYREECGAFLALLAHDATSEVLAAAGAEVTTDPTAVVAAFYDAWDAGDLDSALAFLSPDVTSPAGAQEGLGLVRLRNYMEYVKAVPQTITASDCETLGPTLVNCRVEYRDPVIDSLGISGSNTTHEVSGGLITHITLGSQYARSDTEVARYLREAAPGDLATACAVPDDGTVWGEVGLAYNAECSALVAQHIAAAART